MQHITVLKPLRQLASWQCQRRHPSQLQLQLRESVSNQMISHHLVKSPKTYVLRLSSHIKLSTNVGDRVMLQDPGASVLVAGASGVVGQLVTAKLLDVSSRLQLALASLKSLTNQTSSGLLR